LDGQRKQRIAEEKKIQEARDEADEIERKAENDARKLAMMKTEDIEKRATTLNKKDNELRTDKMLVKKSLTELEEEIEHVNEQVNQAKEDEKMNKRREKQEKFRRIFRDD